MRIITINNVRCVIQAYDKKEFVNLSPIQDSRNTPFDKVLGNIKILFYNNKILTEGRETKYWKEFISNIDVSSVRAELENILSKSLNQ